MFYVTGVKSVVGESERGGGKLESCAAGIASMHALHFQDESPSLRLAFAPEDSAGSRRAVDGSLDPLAFLHITVSQNA